MKSLAVTEGWLFAEIKRLLHFDTLAKSVFFGLLKSGD